MAVSVPWVYVHAIAEQFRTTTQMTSAEADKAALVIRQIAIQAAASALTMAQAYARNEAAAVRTEVTNSLNYMSNYLSDDIHIIRQYVMNELVPALDALADASGGVSDAVMENMIAAYNAIGQSQEKAAEVVDESIVAAGDWIGESYEKVGGWIHEQFDGALAAVNSTIDHILKIPELLVEKALDVLIPAEMEGLKSVVDEMLTGGGMDSWLVSLGKQFGAAIGSVFTFDERDIKEWTFKFVNMIKEQMEAELG